MSKDSEKKVKKTSVKASTKKKSSKKAEPADTSTQVVKPGLKAYVAAVWQLSIQWVKSHKRKAAIVACITLVAVGGLFVLLRPEQRPPTHDEIVIQVNSELSIQGDGNPVVLTVEDKNKATQPFLQQAENGDKVLLYYKAKQAILYRPSEKRIVHQGAYTPPDAKVFIRKGTNEEQPVTTVKDKLNAVKDISLVSEDTSPKKDYKNILIVHVTDRYDDKVRELSETLGAEVVRLPAGETFPDADILVIVGN